ncbi:MAG: hypothetical protein Q9M89_05110 [Persephonella sp.]|nr:hypothetical protein [Persephonella sp.]
MRHTKENKRKSDLLELLPKTKQWKLFLRKEPQKLIEEDLNVDFTTVFLLNVYPYESVFMNDQGLYRPFCDKSCPYILQRARILY